MVDRLRIHRQAMFWQKAAEARRVARAFEATTQRIASIARAKAEELQQLDAQVIAHGQRRSRIDRP